MKILVAIESSENPKKLSDTTLRWAARAGFNMRVFIPDETQAAQYRQAVADANHNWYLDLPPTVVEVQAKPKEYARSEGYDLILYLPDNLRKWNKKLTHDLNVIEYAKQIGEARSAFGKDKTKKAWQFDNGAIMERL